MRVLFTLFLSLFFLTCCKNNISKSTTSLTDRQIIDKVDSRVNLKWNYDYSSHVVYGKLIDNISAVKNSGTCKFNYSIVEALESFKGNIKKGQMFSVLGMSIHESGYEQSYQLLFLKDFELSYYPGFGDCNLEMFPANIAMIHNWCCSIEQSNKKPNDIGLVMYDMINSEQKSDNYIVPAAPVFKKLRKFLSEDSSK